MLIKHYEAYICRAFQQDLVFDRLLLKLIIVLRLQVIVVYGRPYLLFNLAITGQDLLSQFTDWSLGAMSVGLRKRGDGNVVLR